MADMVFPEAAMHASRDELDALPLAVLDGAIPADLGGHCFFIGPVGTVASGGLPYPDQPTVLNGDGMVYRVDLGPSTTLTSRIVKPPSYLADEATAPGTAWELFGFHAMGLARVSLPLGFRNFANTAFVPLGGASGGKSRLLVTYDAGRHVEIDPVTLETLTEIGRRDEWKGEIADNAPFKLILSTAHPFWDAHEGRLYSVNYGRSLFNLMQTLPIVYGLTRLPATVEWFLQRLLDSIERQPQLPHLIGRTAEWLEEQLIWALQLLGIHVPTDFVDMVWWDGSGDLSSVTLLLPDGSPVRIQNSMHQVAATRDFVVLMDTNFKAGFEQWTNNPAHTAPAADRMMRVLLARQQLRETVIYIVRKADLATPTVDRHGRRTVVTRRVAFPLGAVHFLCDYDNPGDHITMHTAHGCALDIAEWMRTFDLSALTEGAIPARLSGMISGEVDLSRVGRYVIDGGTGDVVSSVVTSDDRCTWGVALYAGYGVPAWDLPPGRIEHLYWFSNGLWPELLSKFIVDLYAQYPDRQASVDQVMEAARQGGRPPCLFRLDTATMTIADHYEFHGSRMMSSPQLVPRPGATGQTDGWIVCTVVDATSCQVWIFDAADLAAGPLCKLGNSALSFGFTLHSAWMPVIERTTSSYRVNASREVEPFLQDDPRLAALFDAIPGFGRGPGTSG